MKDCENIVCFFADKEELCKLLIGKFDIIEEIIDALKVFYEATVVSQKPDFTLSEFYKCWIIIGLKLKNLIQKTPNTRLVMHLLKSLNKREAQLIQNELIQCAKVLDPRFCDEIDDLQLEIVEKKLLDIWHRIKTFRNDMQNNNNGSTSLQEVSNSNLFAEYMKNKSRARSHLLENITTDEEIIAVLHSFIENESIAAVEESWSIFEFWEVNKKKYPVLYDLAVNIFCAAPTQVTVERTFSVFGHIFNEHRSRLTQDLLEDILMICLNSDLLYEVNDEDMQYLVETENDS